MEGWHGRVAVVTGAGSGIGAAVSCRLLKEGLTVVGIDLNLNGLEELAKRYNSTEKEVMKFCIASLYI